jgi:hippurate hydrolase
MSDAISNASADVLANLGGLLSDLEAAYKDLHAHPELSMQEKRTAGLAADRLRAAGYEVTTGIGNTGVVGVLRNGEGLTVMLRADMDALPVQEATGLPYASKATADDGTGGKCMRPRFAPLVLRCADQVLQKYRQPAGARARAVWSGIRLRFALRHDDLPRGGRYGEPTTPGCTRVVS